MKALSNPPKPFRIQNQLQAVLRACGLSLVCIVSFASIAFAHDGSESSHVYATDLRITPRSAVIHTTGTLPRSSGESTTATTRVVSEIRDRL